MQRIELPIPIQELFERWKSGRRIKDLAKEYKVSYTVVRRILMEYDFKDYKEIARIKRAGKNKKKLSVIASELYELWKNGKSIRALAKKHKVSRQTIARRLKEYNEQEYGEIAKNKIAVSIAERRKKIPVPPNEILDRWMKGESTATLAREYRVSRQTISRILVKHNKEEYLKTVKDRITSARTKELLIPITELLERWKKGESPENLEKISGVNYRTILNKLAKFFKQQYKEIAEKRSGFGSVRAKRLGADSLFELNVRRILEKHGIQSKKSTLKLGKHNYRPDFPLLEQDTIIEAMGLNFNSYWKRNARKTRDYVHHKYVVIAVVPDEQLYQNAKKCLNKKVRILRYNEFEKFVSTSLKKAPNRKRFPPQLKDSL